VEAAGGGGGGGRYRRPFLREWAVFVLAVAIGGGAFLVLDVEPVLCAVAVGAVVAAMRAVDTRSVRIFMVGIPGRTTQEIHQTTPGRPVRCPAVLVAS
jgi:hypothetical protein